MSLKLDLMITVRLEQFIEYVKNLNKRTNK